MLSDQKRRLSSADAARFQLRTSSMSRSATRNYSGGGGSGRKRVSRSNFSKQLQFGPKKPKSLAYYIARCLWLLMICFGIFALYMLYSIFFAASLTATPLPVHKDDNDHRIQVQPNQLNALQKLKNFKENINIVKNIKTGVTSNLQMFDKLEDAINDIQFQPDVNDNGNGNGNAVNDAGGGPLSARFRIYSNVNCDETKAIEYLTFSFTANETMKEEDMKVSFCTAFMPDGTALTNNAVIKSIKVFKLNPQQHSNSQLNLYQNCKTTNYHATVYDFQECVRVYDWPRTQSLRVVPNSLREFQALPAAIPSADLPPIQARLSEEGISRASILQSYDAAVPRYQIVYSCESSDYCAFQAQANYYGFLTSGQHPHATSLRLLTSSEADDMADYIPTFTAPRHPYSRRYAPINKADVMVKWFQSVNRPDAEILVIIDPDNWVLRDVSKWVKRASEGHALGEAAWFHGNHLVTQLWKEVCLANCDFNLDMVGVPYIIHKNDLEKLAPFFLMYIEIMKAREEKDKAFLNKYRGIQMGWGTEMFGYIFGAAHAGIKHEVVHGIQRRDVSHRPKSKTEERSLAMIHMGRAWFPHEYAPSKRWAHTEGAAWKRFGQQVWCKCNFTASDIIPWPLPEQIDWQSYHTLYLLHYGREYFGPLPKSRFRKPGKQYHEPYM